MNVLLLAAGEGTRFRPHTQVLPKPAIPLCGIPLLFYSTALLQDMKINNLVINTYHLPKSIHLLGEKLKNKYSSIHFSDEVGVLLGSGGGIANAQNLLRDSNGFLTLNADEVILPKKLNILREFVECSQNSEALASLVVMRHPEAGKKFNAVWAKKNGEILDFGKVKPTSNVNEEIIPYHFIGPMYFKNKIFDYLMVEPSNIIHDILKYAMTQGQKVEVFPIECEWYETGNLSDYLIATERLITQINNEDSLIHQMKAEYLKDWSLTITSESSILKHSTAQISDQSFMKGFVVLGPQSMVGPGVGLHNIVCHQGVNLTQPSRFENELFLT